MTSLCTSALLAGCAGWPLASDRTREYLDWVSEVRAAPAADRTRLWLQVGGDDDEGTRLRRAILQSYGGHPSHNPAEAVKSLEALAKNGRGDVVAVARWRLGELRADGQCRAEVNALKERLGKVADIERTTAPTGGD